MRNLAALADTIGERLTSAGYALDTLANLLGADGHDHHLSPDDFSGLTHAVRAIAGYVLASGFDLCQAAELQSQQETSAPEGQGGEA